jgi:hypothetical protein
MDSDDLGCENIFGCDNAAVSVRQTMSGLIASSLNKSRTRTHAFAVQRSLLHLTCK